MIRVRPGEPLPPAAPLEVRLLWRCASQGVRVAASAVLLDPEDGPDVALAAALGPLPPGTLDLVPVPGNAVRDVPADDVPALADALRMTLAPGVLVVPQPAAVHAGRAELRPDRAYDVVRSVEGRAHEVATAREVRTLHVPVLAHPWSRPHRGADEWRTPLPPWGMRLSRELRRVRAALPGDALDVDWADDGRRVHVLEVRPAT